MGEKVINFETNDTNLNYSSELGFHDIKYPFAYGEENIHFVLHLKYIPFQEYKNSTEKDEYEYLYKKGDENKGIVEYGNDFLNCKIISYKNSNQMDYYCEVRDKFIKPKSKYTHFKSNIQKELDKCKHIQLTIENPNTNSIDEIIFAYIIEHKKL